MVVVVGGWGEMSYPCKKGRGIVRAEEMYVREVKCPTVTGTNTYS